MNKPFVVLITGDRNWYENPEDGTACIYDELVLLKQSYKDLLVIQGSCKGADLQAESYCKELEINYIGIPAKWTQYGRAAGPIRNQEMLSFAMNYFGIDLALAFHNNISESRGTRDMITRLMKAGVVTKLFNYEGFVKTINPKQLELF